MHDAVTVHMAAPPDEIWELVSDVTKIGRYSPETFEAEWLDGATGPAVGAKFRGHVKRNGKGPIYWTTCTVHRLRAGPRVRVRRRPGRQAAERLALPARAGRRRHRRHRVVPARADSAGCASTGRCSVGPGAAPTATACAPRSNGSRRKSKEMHLMPDADTLAELADRRRDLRERFVKPPDERPASTGRRRPPPGADLLGPRDDDHVLPRPARASRSSSCSRTATTRARPTSSSTSATGTCWPSSTSPASGSSRCPRASAACSTSPSRSPPSSSRRPRRASSVAGVVYRGPDLGVEESIYFKDPDNIQVELIRQPLFEMPESAPEET